MNLEKISRVITLATELITRAEHVETEPGADGFLHLRHRRDRSPPPHQHGTDEGARGSEEARVNCPRCGAPVIHDGCLCPGPAFIPVPQRPLPWPYENMAEWIDENVPDGYGFQPATDCTVAGWGRRHGKHLRATAEKMAHLLGDFPLHQRRPHPPGRSRRADRPAKNGTLCRDPRAVPDRRGSKALSDCRDCTKGCATGATTW
jgi:hypothetical protein